MFARLEKTWIVLAVVSLSVLAVGLMGALPVRSQDATQIPARSVDGTVAETIGYQGMLTDSAGVPLDGMYAMRFHLFRQPTGGTPVSDSGVLEVMVNGGLFDIGLDVPQSVFDGSQLWLSVTVEEEALSPRQQIRPAPYAMSLRPGATVMQGATGTALQVESAEGIGLQAAGQVYGLYGTTTGTTQGSGYGGFFESGTGIGVMGRSTAFSTASNLYAPGVAGYSQRGVGVLGQAATGFGVYGTSDGSGLGGVGRAYGIYGASSSTTQGAGYGGYFESSTGIGVAGRSTALPTVSNLYAPGVYGYSNNGVGIMGEAGNGIGSIAGYFQGNVIVDGNLIVTGNKTGYVVDIALNDGIAPLVQGDLVIVTGVTDPLVGNIPVPRVCKTTAEASTAVIGIVDTAYRTDESGVFFTADGPIHPGDYLGVVTLGVFGTLKVDAIYGEIQPGDLLVSSPTPGHAMRAENPPRGTVVGKALSALAEGRGVIAVLVTLQ
jgi:hypothetical protein